MTETSTPRMGFYLNVDGCTGCKACQIACKNKNGLAPSSLWRRVVEVSGGGWTKRGDAWLQQTTTYNLSISCMHCADPICAQVCPTRAMQAREDGVVFVDDDRCMGCSYCEMACPYGAPSMDPDRGVMGKCDLCRDNLDEGKAPECVSACQMRVLEYGPIDELRARLGQDAKLYPLPTRAPTDPSFVFTPHRETQDSTVILVIANREDLK